MSKLVVTGNELFIVVTDNDAGRAKETGYDQFAIGPLEDAEVQGKRVSRMDQASYWLNFFHRGPAGPNYKALVVVGAVATRLFPKALQKLEEDMDKLVEEGNALDGH